MESSFTADANILVPVTRTGGTSGNFGAATTSPQSLAFTLPSGSTYLVAMISIYIDGSDVSAMTWKPDSGNSGSDQTMTLIGKYTVGNPGSVEIWGLANPTATVTGSVIEHSLDVASKRIMGIHALKGVGAVGPTSGTNAGGTTIGVSVASRAGGRVFDVLFGQNSTTTYTASAGPPAQTERWDTNTTGGLNNLRGAGSEEVGANGNVSMDWTAGASTNKSLIGVSFNPNLVSGFSADAVITAPLSFTADAVIMPRFSADAVLLKTIADSFTADAVIMPRFSGDSILLKTQIGSYSEDAISLKIQTGSFTSDAFLQQGTVSDSFLVDAILFKTQAASLTADAIILRTQTGSFVADAVLARTQTGSWTTDAIVFRTALGSIVADAVLFRLQSSVFAADAYLATTVGGSFVADAFVQPYFRADAVIASGSSLTANAVIERNQSSAFTADAVKRKAQSSSFTANAIKLKIVGQSFSGDAYIRPPYRVQHARTGPHVGTDPTDAHTIAWSFDRYRRHDNLHDLLVDFDARLTAKEAGKISKLGRIQSEAVTKAPGAGSFVADAFSIIRVLGSFLANAFVQPYFRAKAWVVDSAIYLADNVLTAPTWPIDTTPRAAFVNTASLSHDPTNDPQWYWGDSTPYLTAWAKFTLTSTKTVILDTVMTQGNSVIELWTGGPPSWPADPVGYGDDEIANEDSPYPDADQISMELNAGTYWVLLHKWNESDPDFSIVLRMRTTT